MELWQQLINALTLSCLYALISLGYTLVFGVLRLINFAHGDIVMVGGYFCYIFCRMLRLNLILSTILSIVLCCLLGMIIEWAVYRPLKHTGGMELLVAAIGVSLLLQYVVMAIFSAQPLTFAPDWLDCMISIYGVKTSLLKLVIIVVCLLCLVIISIILGKTKTGRAMRAVSNDMTAAFLCGIDDNKTRAAAFAIGCGLAAICGVLMGKLYVLTPLMGASPGLKAFCAAVIGGIGSIPGAVLGGFVIGFGETLSGMLFSTAYKDAVAFVLMCLVLLFLPKGLLGRRTEKL